MKPMLFDKNINERMVAMDMRIRELVPIIFEAAGRLDSDKGIKLIKKIRAYNHSKELDTVLENTMKAFKNYDYDKAIEILKAI